MPLQPGLLLVGGLFLATLFSNGTHQMLDLYTWNTPNGRKTTIMLEEIAQPYTLKPIDINTGQQKAPDFLRINPNGRIPALFDHEAGARIFESGAILLYLAERFPKGEALLPNTPVARAEVLSWTYWQTGGLGPMLGQYNHFSSAEGKANYALERFKNESLRLLNVLEIRLKESAYLGGDNYSVADIMNYPWVSSALNTLPEAFTQLTAVKSWHNTIAARPTVITGLQRLTDLSQSRY